MVFPFMKLIANEVSVDFAGTKIDMLIVTDNSFRSLLPVNEFLLDVAMSDAGRNTMRALAFDLMSFFSTILSQADVYSLIPKDFQDINEQHMNIYLNMLEKRGLSRITICRHVSTLRKFYAAVYKFGYLQFPKRFLFGKYDRFNKHQFKSTRQIISHYIDSVEFEKISSCVPGSNSFLRARNELALMLGIEAGLRTHELNNYKNFAIDQLKDQLSVGSITGFLLVYGKGNKGRNIPISVVLMKKLHRFLYGDLKTHVNKYLFENRHAEEMKNNSFGTDLFNESRNKFLSENEVNVETFKTLKNWSYHSLRHTCATNWVTLCHNHGWPIEITVQEWMGHAFIGTTKRYVDSEAVLKSRVELLIKRKNNESRNNNING